MSALLLRAEPLRRVNHAVTTFLRPFDHSTSEGWQRAVNAALRRALDADSATFDLPVAGKPHMISRQLDGKRLASYHVEIADMASLVDMYRRIASLGVWTRRAVWLGAEERYYRSAYYNEFVRPLRAYDAIGMTTPLESGGQATVFLHHERATGSKFGRHGSDILTLCFQAFRSGAHWWDRLGGYVKRLASSVDEVDVPLWVLDLRGRVIHQNPAATIEVACSPDWPARSAALRRIAAAVGGRALRPMAELDGHLSTAQSSGSNAFHGALVSDDLAWSEPVVVVMPRLGSDAAFADLPMSHLTEREREVAQLLCHRWTSREIASYLGISVHTARRHSEAVLRKLGVSSRREVASVLGRTSHNRSEAGR